MDCPDNGQWLRQDVGYFSWEVLENLVYIDRVCAEIFEFSQAKGAIGLPIEDFLGRVSALDRERIARAIHENLLSGGMYNEEYSLSLPSGITRRVKVSGRMVLDEEGVPLRGMGTMVDVTVEHLLGTRVIHQ